MVNRQSDKIELKVKFSQNWVKPRLKSSDLRLNWMYQCNAALILLLLTSDTVDTKTGTFSDLRTAVIFTGLSSSSFHYLLLPYSLVP